MANKNKSKIVPLRAQHQSPENYIKTQARSLPIFECLMTQDWKDVGICNIIVSRQHKSGNVTAGVYLVDLYCLGVKNATYHFNLDPDDFEFIKGNCGDVQTCDYVLAHNIIYGAVAYADDYGLKPHKDFEIAQYILEEDDEAIELMELEFGLEGIPFYVRGPHDDDARIKQIKATLMRTAGEGNFSVVEDIEGVEGSDWFDPDLDAWLDEEDDEDLDEEGDEDEDGEMSEEQAELLDELLYKKKPIDKVYDKAIRTTEAREMLRRSVIGKGIRLSNDAVKDEWNVFDDIEQESAYHLAFELFNNSEFAEAIKTLKKAIIKYPLRPQFYNLLQGAYIFTEQFDKSNELTNKVIKLFPGYLFATVPYFNMLMDEGRAEEGITVFNGATDLKEIYPERKVFHVHEAAIFYATMCRYFIAVDDIDRADMYMNVIIKKGLHHVPTQNMVNKALMELINAKIIAVKDKLGF